MLEIGSEFWQVDDSTKKIIYFQVKQNGSFQGKMHSIVLLMILKASIMYLLLRYHRGVVTV